MTWEIRQGDCLEVLREMPSESVQCCVTSPPYWGLRDYGTARWEGGDTDCDHFKLAGGTGAQNLGKSAAASAANVQRSSVPFRDLCGKCGAIRVDGQLGLERTPEEYVAKMVEVFREVRRVLKSDGTLWLNIGDSYAANRGYQVPDGKWVDVGNSKGMKAADFGLKAKDLVGIPWMLAFALRADGWYLRQDIIWAKPNPMPESVRDRCTKSHEYIFLLSKSERYFYDADAIREPFAEASIERLSQDVENQTGSFRVPGKTNGPIKAVGLNGNRSSYRPGSASSMNDGEHVTKSDAGLPLNPLGRNKRSVWNVTTQGYSEAHFATFPPEIPEICIKAGTKECDTVLDPFNGAGTTGLVATRLMRNYIGIELNSEYVAMAQNRIEQDAPLFNVMEGT